MIFSRILWSILSCSLFASLIACATVGGVMQSVGGGLTDYSKKEEGFVGRVAGVAGEVYTIVGTAVKGEARSSSSAPPARPALAPAQAPTDGTPGPAVETAATPLHSSSRASGGTTTGGDASVLEAQKILLTLGYDVGKADGLIGRRTSSALKLFQTSVGLSSNGVIDSMTMAALRNSAAAVSKPVVESASTLKQPKESEAVKGSLSNL